MKARQFLIETNIRWLEQALALLSRIDDESYSAIAPGMAPHRAGAHLRHVVEFYQAFLDGVEGFHIDYDARRRDPQIECSRAAATRAIETIIERLRAEATLRFEAVVWVRMEDAPAGMRDGFLESTITRELQVLGSHTIHHFALIAIALRLHGVEMDPDFGMAPSTLRYRSSRVAEAA